MARKKEPKNTEDSGPDQSPSSLAFKFLKENKDDHYNFEEDNYKLVANSSLIMNMVLGGGMPSGAHRAVGYTSAGKTSNTLDFLFNFLKDNPKSKHFGLYVKSEGRLPQQMKERSGVKFVTNPEEWVAGTCLILESNVYETVFSFIGKLIRENPNKNSYFFIIDSMDMMAKRDDLAKPLEDSAQVAGGALITSVFLKKTSTALAKRGHYMVFISQVRDSIQINPYAGAQTPRQGRASGGHALEHAGDLVLEFLPSKMDDYILENPNDKKSKPIGHYCNIKVLKSNNETRNQIITYPVKYGRTGGKSVWIEREVVDLMLMWNLLTKAGSWYSVDPNLIAETTEAKINLNEKYQGLDSIYSFFEENPETVEFMRKKFNAMF